MFQYLLILIAGIAVIGGSSLESLASLSGPTDYLVAFGVALLLKPWLQSHFE